jgi:cytochrome c-type biogenesis protein CcmE
VIALSVAAVLAVFLLYTSAFGGTPALQPSELQGRAGTVGLSGRVVAPVQRDGRTVTFRLRDIGGATSIPVRYTGSVPDLFALGRDVHVEGKLHGGVFVGAPDTLVTRCPSKYKPTRADGSA